MDFFPGATFNFFLPNVPRATFIQGGTFIPESRVGVPFHPVVVIGLGKNLLLKSVLGHCVEDGTGNVKGMQIFPHFTKGIHSQMSTGGR